MAPIERSRMPQTHSTGSLPVRAALAVALALSLLAVATGSASAAWNEIGGTPLGGPHSSFNVGDGPEAAQVGLTTYVAWIETANNHSEVEVSRLNDAGTGWDRVGGQIS